MAQLFLEVCLNHPGREAVARCPECRRFYCRECVTEHEDRLICASCLRRLSARPEERKLSLAPLFRLTVAGLGVLVAWICFYGLGQVLLRTPSQFHEGTIWKQSFFNRGE